MRIENKLAGRIIILLETDNQIPISLIEAQCSQEFCTCFLLIGRMTGVTH